MEEFKSRTNGKSPDEFINDLRKGNINEIIKEIEKNRDLFSFLDEHEYNPKKIIISTHEDKVLESFIGYGDAKKPEDLNGANLTENAAKLCNFFCINNRFLAMWLSSNMAQYQIKDKISSATLGKLSLTRIKSLLIPLPPLEEQIELIKKSILAKAFRGQLGTNNPTEESAIKLLKKVLSEK